MNKSKKFVFNGKSLVNNELFGIQRNTLEILKELDNLSPDYQIELVIPNTGKLNATFKNIKVVMLDWKKIPFFRSHYWDEIIFPSYVKKVDGIGIDLLLSLPHKGCEIIAIYDCIRESFPQNAKSLKDAFFRFLYIKKVKNALAKCHLVIADSKYAKSDIMKFYHIPDDKIKVVYCGWQHETSIIEDDSVIDELRLDKYNYFFSLGSRYYHKNSKWIVEAAKLNPKYKFVITGTLKFDKKDDDCILPNVLFTGYLSDEKVKALMHYCKAFIQPSLYEGFGIPPMEAMSVGTKCIVSNVTALPEVYGNSVWYIDPTDYDHIDLDKIMREKIDSNSVVLNKYSWKKSAESLNLLLSTYTKY